MIKKIFLILIILTSIFLLGCNNNEITSDVTSEIKITSNSLTRADTEYVCMINNELFK